MNRSALLDRLAQAIDHTPCFHPLRVGIDGIDAAGKTSLADELAGALRDRGRAVIRASLDGFHNPRAVRYARGPLSPEGYFLDSFNYPLLKQALLDPLGAGGSRVYRAAAYDHRADCPLNLPEQIAPQNAVLLFDGVFLFRPELAGYFDLKIFVDIPFEESLRRALLRDLLVLGSCEAVEERYRLRYIPGQQLYFSLCKPSLTADWVVDNEDVMNPSLLSNGSLETGVVKSAFRGV